MHNGYRIEVKPDNLLMNLAFRFKYFFLFTLSGLNKLSLKTFDQ